MFFGGSKKENRAAKWTVQVVMVCILIYLGIRHVDAVAGAVIWMADLFEPLILGSILAFVLDVPMDPIERHLFQKRSCAGKYGKCREIIFCITKKLKRQPGRPNRYVPWCSGCFCPVSAYKRSHGMERTARLKRK